MRAPLWGTHFLLKADNQRITLHATYYIGSW